MLAWYGVAIALGIFTADNFSLSLTALLLIAAIILLLTGYRLWNNREAVCLLLISCFITGAVSSVYNQQVAKDDISNFIGQSVMVYAIVDGTPEVLRPTVDAKWRVRYRLRAVQVKANQTLQPVSGKLFANVRQEAEQPVYWHGAHLLFTGKLTALTTLHNPGMPDVVGSWRRQGYSARLLPLKPPDYVGHTDNDWGAKINALRVALTQHMAAAMPDADAAMLKGALFGGYNGIAESAIREFAATGIIHILSVSGSHIALVAGAVHWLSALIGLDRRQSALLAASAVILYALLAGLSPPVLRSAAMGLMALLATVWGRDNDPLNALVLTASAMLLYEPGYLNDISFQLSFGGTAGLVLFYQPTRQTITRFPEWLARPIAATMSAQLGVLPIMAWYFSIIPLMAFAANLLVVPIIELSVVLGLVGGVVSLLLPQVAMIIFVGCSLFLSAAKHINTLLAAMPLVVYLPPLSVSVGLLYYSVLLWAYGYTRTLLPTPGVVIRRYFRQIVVGGSLCALGLGLWYLQPRPLAIHFIDVGQGDATLVITPRGNSVLIDTGGSVDFDIGERVVFPYLRRHHVTQLDYLILTHGHQDHAGGAAAVVSAVNTKQVLLPPEPPSQAIKDLKRLQRAPMVLVHGGQTFSLDGVEFLLMHAPLPLDKADNSNDNSCVVEIRYGQQSFLITGDLEGDGERRLLAQGVLRPQSVLKVGHHGAKVSSTAEFLAVVRPAYAVISVGAGNRYGHPHPETLQRLSAVRVFRTDKNGAIVFTTNGVDLAVSPYLN